MKTSLASRFEREDCVLLGRNGRAVAGSWMKGPVFKRRKRFVVDLWPQALQDDFTDDFPTLIDGYFDDLITTGIVHLPGLYNRIRTGGGKSGTNFIYEPMSL